MAKPIIFHDEWEGVDDQELRNSFLLLSEAEIADLKPGSEVYVFDDFIDPRGKVYGYLPIVITSVEREGGDTIVRYDDEDASGMVKIETPNRSVYKRG